jgi:hypothetical protein
MEGDNESNRCATAVHRPEIAGRQGLHPRVALRPDRGRKLVTTIMVPCIPFAWETVTRAVNSGAILQSDCD